MSQFVVFTALEQKSTLFSKICPQTRFAGLPIFSCLSSVHYFFFLLDSYNISHRNVWLWHLNPWMLPKYCEGFVVIKYRPAGQVPCVEVYCYQYLYTWGAWVWGEVWRNAVTTQSYNEWCNPLLVVQHSSYLVSSTPSLPPAPGLALLLAWLYG